MLSLLGLLLVERGKAVHLDRIVDELWPGTGPRNARNAVHVLTSRLRAVIGDRSVVSEGGGYTLRLAEDGLDANRFERALASAREEVALSPATAAAVLREALMLWRGPALADLGDQGFAQPEIARLEELRLACLAERIDADLACGRHAVLGGELTGLVQQHPLRERFRGQLMIALYRAGRQAEALDEYRAAHRVLADDLGIEPAPELRALEAAILRHELPASPQRPERPAYDAPLAVDRAGGVTWSRPRSRGVFRALGPCASATATRAA